MPAVDAVALKYAYGAEIEFGEFDDYHSPDEIMPALDASSQKPPENSSYQDEVEAWAMPLGAIGGIRLQLSYSVFVAFAVLAGMVAMVKGNAGNSDLPMVAILGSSFWVAGWLVQVMTLCCFRFAGQVPIQTVTIGLLGVESRRRSWSAPMALMVTSATIGSIVLFGGVLILCERALIGPRPLTSALSVFTAPGMGLTKGEFVFLAGAWLCWIQAMCQMFPVPRSLGRVWLVSLVSLLAPKADHPTQVDIARRMLQVIATITAIIAVASINREGNLVIPRWPLLMLLSIVLWITAWRPDVAKMLTSFHSFSPEAAGVTSVRTQQTWLSRTTDTIRSLRFRRKARKALQREHAEAVDAARLDQILQQLHQDGIDSLSESDRAILHRVSQSLRRQRDSDVVSRDNAAGQ